MKTTSELKKEVKNLLGINPRDYSLRRDRGDYQITVKNPAIGLEQLKEHFKQFEHIYRCEVTHEILSGGNTYVTVQYDWEMPERNELRKNIMNVAQEVLGSPENNWGASFWNPWIPRQLRELVIERASENIGIHKDYAGHLFGTPMIHEEWVQNVLPKA